MVMYKPADNYDDLKNQFLAAVRIVQAQEKALLVAHASWREVMAKDVLVSAEENNSLRVTNQVLTDMVDRLEAEAVELRKDVWVVEILDTASGLWILHSIQAREELAIAIKQAREASEKAAPTRYSRTTVKR